MLIKNDFICIRHTWKIDSFPIVFVYHDRNIFPIVGKILLEIEIYIHENLYLAKVYYLFCNMPS
jgi:hypothetical protein